MMFCEVHPPVGKADDHFTLEIRKHELLLKFVLIYSVRIIEKNYILMNLSKIILIHNSFL